MEDSGLQQSQQSGAFVQAAMHEAKATLYGLTALSAGVITLASLPLTRLSTWSQSLLGKSAGGYVSRALSAPTEITARTALKFIDMKRTEHLKSEAVHAPAADWPRIFSETTETLFMGYEAVRDECREMSMMLPEISYVYQAANDVVVQKPSILSALAARVAEKREAYVKAKAEAKKAEVKQIEQVKEEKPATTGASEWISAPVSFIPVLPVEPLEETARKDGVWLASAPVIVAAPEPEKKPSKKATAKKIAKIKAEALQKSEPPALEAVIVEEKPKAPPVLIPLLKGISAHMQITLQVAGKRAAILKGKAEEGVRTAVQRLEEKRQARLAALEAEKLRQEQEAEAVKLAQAQERAMEENTIELTAVEVEPVPEIILAAEVLEAAPVIILPEIKLLAAPMAMEEKASEAVMEAPAAEKIVETVVVEKIVEVEKLIEIEKLVEVEKLVEIEKIVEVEKLVEVEKIVEIEKIVEKIVEVEKAAPSASIPAEVTSITPTMLRQALETKDAAARAVRDIEQAVAAAFSSPVTSITPVMLQKAIEEKQAVVEPVIAQVPMAEVQLEKIEVKKEEKTENDAAAFFLLPPAPVVVAPAAQPVDDMAARAAAFLFPPAVALDIVVQPALMPVVVEVKKPKIAKTYNFSSNDNRSSKLPPLKDIPRGVVVSKR